MIEAPMPVDPLVARVSELLGAAQHRYRTQRGWGAMVSPPIPPRLIDEVAEGLAPLLRDLVREAVDEREAAR